MILSHFTAKPFVFRPRRKYKIESSRFPPMKPRGLWLSDEKDFGWKQWCDEQQWNLSSLVHRTDFVVLDNSQWLVLDNAQKILEFTREFKIPDEKFAVLRSIDWARVQKEYAGILISPYQWSLRFHAETFWYYGWDCASACVWNLKTVKVKQ